MRIALFHDFLDRMGGAEYVLKIMHEVFPNADIRTFFMDGKKASEYLPGSTITVHPPAQRSYELRKKIVPSSWVTKSLVTRFPKWVSQINLDDYDIVISNSGAWCHGIITSVETTHIVYMHSPMRFAWDWTHEYRKQLAKNPVIGFLLLSLISRIRLWDKMSSARTSHLICNSRLVQKRIAKYYKRDATVIHPPVDIVHIPCGNNPRENYMVCMGTLTPYKRFDVIIKAMNTLEQPLVIIGDGPDRAPLESIAGKHITFTGRLNDEERNALLGKAKGFIQMSEEDFGIVPVEAMAAGTPAICFRKGGAQEVIQEGINGLFAKEQTSDSLLTAMKEFETHSWDPKVIRKTVEHFSKERFMKEFSRYVYQAHESNKG